MAARPPAGDRDGIALVVGLNVPATITVCRWARSTLLAGAGKLVCAAVSAIGDRAQARVVRRQRKSIVILAVVCLAATACHPGPTSGTAPPVCDPERASTEVTPAVPTPAVPMPKVPTAPAPAVIRDITAGIPVGHPRLWITADDLPRLRTWAAATNPVWADGLSRVLAQVRTTVDSGRAIVGRSAGWVEDPVEVDAEVLAFASLVEPDPSMRAADQQRARRLLLRGISAAARGAADGSAYRDPSFSIDDRSRWWGEGWAVTVDWIYPALTAADRAAVRAVFLRWAAEDEAGGQTTNDHPIPVGAHDAPALVEDPAAVVWSANNYYTAHGRNLALMALALDPADDPGGQLRGHLRSAVGGFLWVTDTMLRTVGRGGAPLEGLEYGPQSLGYVAQTLLALHTTELDRSGPAVTRIEGNPFWDDLAPWLASTLSPTATAGTDGETAWLPASYGDTQVYRNPDWIQLLAPLALQAADRGDEHAVAAFRWLETHTVGNGPAGLLGRISGAADPADAIWYFLLLDPTAPAPADPRPAYPPTNIAEGIGRVSARTGWGADARWLTVDAGRAQIDHQDGDGLDIALYRKGEWLTKERTGYDLATSDQKNSLAIENDPPEHREPDDARGIAWAHGSQYLYVNDGPGRLVATNTTGDYSYTAVDATSLYNSTQEGSHDVLDAARAALWLKPDVLVVYDRAVTGKAGRYKRFELQLPAAPRIEGAEARVTTSGGQQLDVRTLLPAGATPTSELVRVDANRSVGDEGQVAEGEPMTNRLTVDAPGRPANARFLHVLQGLDPGQATRPVTLVTSSDGDHVDGAAVGTDLVLFPTLTGHPADVQVNVPAGVRTASVTGLTPGGGYTTVPTDRNLRVIAGGDRRADAAGVLVVALG
jgi:hypothetical protein